MKFYMLKNFMMTLVILTMVPAVQAQFDDVYYDPDNLDPAIDARYENTGQENTGQEYTYEDEVTYYDNDEYAYYDDYDYYYSSRIRRFHRPYSGFDFYDPVYVSYNYYDPFFADSYYYPGSSIYISFGNNGYSDYRQWRRWSRWNRWNSFNSWNNWCLTPANYYYSYNNWYGPSYNYWGGNHGYYSYSNYYNNYYNSCPLPISHYNGITNTTVNHINNGGTRGTYYGPRVTGNTGSSPRGPAIPPGSVQPVYGTDVSESRDRPVGVPDKINPERTLPGDPVVRPGTELRPSEVPGSREETTPGVVKQIPVDKELRRDETVTPEPKRPVFRPDADKYQPYPTTERPKPASGAPVTEKPVTRPTYTPEQKPTTPTRENYSPRPTEQRPAYTPPQREETKPSYNPPARSNKELPAYSPPQRNEERPSYTPPQRKPEEQKSNDRPSYSPPQREAQRSNDRPSYSPPQRSNDSSRTMDRSSSSPSPSRDNSSSGGNRSSGSSSGSSSSSPRGRG